MIEGLNFDMKPDELRSHFQERAKHHADREAFYRQQAAALEAQVGDQPETGLPSYSGHQNPQESLKQSAAQHAHRRVFFQFLADHVIEETYRLTESDLTRLELLDRYL